MKLALTDIIDNIENSNKLIYLILILSLVVNVIVVFTFYPIHPKAETDAVQYNKIGLNIATGKGFSLDGKTPTAFREPLYPFFIAIIYFIFGYNPIVVKLAQALIGVAIVLLVFKIGERIFNRRIALAVALLTAIWIPLMRYCGNLITEILFTFALIVSAYCLLKLKERPVIWMAALCGLTLGLGTLTRVTLLFIPFFVLFWMLIAFPIKKTQIIRLWIVLFISMMIPVSLWIVRCYITEGQFVLLTTHTDKVLYYRARTIEKRTVTNEDDRTIPSTYEEWNEQKSKLKNPVVSLTREILAHPKEYFLLIYRNFRMFWNPVTRTFIKQDIAYYILYVAILLIYAFALNGMVKTFLPRNFNSGSALISLFIIYLTLIHSLTHGRQPRYRRPIMPFVILLAFYGVFVILDYLRQLKSSRRSQTAGQATGE